MSRTNAHRPTETTIRTLSNPFTITLTHTCLQDESQANARDGNSLQMAYYSSGVMEFRQLMFYAVCDEYREN